MATDPPARKMPPPMPEKAPPEKAPKVEPSKAQQATAQLSSSQLAQVAETVSAPLTAAPQAATPAVAPTASAPDLLLKDPVQRITKSLSDHRQARLANPKLDDVDRQRLWFLEQQARFGQLLTRPTPAAELYQAGMDVVKTVFLALDMVGALTAVAGGAIPDSASPSSKEEKA